VTPPPDHFIETAAALADVVARFRRAPLVAADTEAASFHRYRDRIYLIQLSAGAETAVVDPLAVTDLGPIGALLADPQVEQPGVQRAYLVPSFTTGKRGDSEALEVLAHLMGAGSNSRLYRDLVVDKQLAVSANAWYDSLVVDMSKFGLYAVPRPGVTLPDLEKEIDAVIAKIIDQGVSAEELERSKTKLIADAVYTNDSQVGMARWYGGALTTGSTVNDVNHWTDRIRAVTAAQVQHAARQWLDLRCSVTGYLIKDKSAPPEKRS